MLGVLVVFRDTSQEFLARRSGADFVSHVSHELKSPLNVLGFELINPLFWEIETTLNLYTKPGEALLH